MTDLKFTAKSINDELDYLTAALQQVALDVGGPFRLKETKGPAISNDKDALIRQLVAEMQHAVSAFDGRDIWVAAIILRNAIAAAKEAGY